MHLPTIDPSAGLMRQLPDTRREFRPARQIYMVRTFSRAASQTGDPIERELLRMVADDSRVKAARIRQDRRNKPGQIDPSPARHRGARGPYEGERTIK